MVVGLGGVGWGGGGGGDGEQICDATSAIVPIMRMRGLWEFRRVAKKPH